MLELLKAQRFRSVFCIDDENALPPIDTLERLASCLVESAPRARKRLAKADAFFDEPVAIAEDVHLDPEAKKAEIRAWLDRQNPDDLTGARLISTREILFQGHTGPTHGRLRKQLREAEVELRAFSFKQWQDEGEALLSAATDDARILLLVDEINEIELDVDLNGQDVLSHFLATQQDRLGCIDAIMVTSNCTPDGELEESQKVYEQVSELLREKGIERSFKKVFVLSKHRLVNDSFVESFEWQLNRLEASRLSIQLADAARKVLESAVIESLDWLKRIPLLEFHHSIFVTAANEGAAEIDTLVRLASIKQRVALEKLLREDSDVQRCIEGMRKVTRTGLGSQGSRISTPILRELREQEFERPGQHINALRAPLACGDVFELEITAADGSPANLTGMLLVNPCDLVIRQEGKRKLTTGLFVEVEKTTRQVAERNAANEKATAPLTYRLATGDADDDIVYVFHNSRVESIPLSVLDLCWTNSSGLAELSPQSVLEHLNALTPPQKLRLINLARRNEEGWFPRLEIWGKDLVADRVEVPPVQVVELSLGWSIKYPIKRIWRLAPEFAAAALAALAQSLARPAFGHDFRQN